VVRNGADNKVTLFARTAVGSGSAEGANRRHVPILPWSAARHWGTVSLVHARFAARERLLGCPCVSGARGVRKLSDFYYRGGDRFGDDQRESGSYVADVLASSSSLANIVRSGAIVEGLPPERCWNSWTMCIWS
jgi:hypothetical protein